VESAQPARHLLKELAQLRALYFESLLAVGPLAEQALYPGRRRGKE